MFVTDGMLERNAADLELERLIAAGAHLHPREAVQQVIHALLKLTGGELKDDASVLCLDWHGGPPRDRATASGGHTVTRRRRPGAQSSPRARVRMSRSAVASSGDRDAIVGGGSPARRSISICMRSPSAVRRTAFTRRSRA